MKCFCIRACYTDDQEFPLDAMQSLVRAHTLDTPAYEYLYQFYWAGIRHTTNALQSRAQCVAMSSKDTIPICVCAVRAYMYGYSCNKRRMRCGISSYLIFFSLCFVNAIQIHFSCLYAFIMRCDEFWRRWAEHWAASRAHIRSTSFKRIMELIMNGFFAPCIVNACY